MINIFLYCITLIVLVYKCEEHKLIVVQQRAPLVKVKKKVTTLQDIDISGLYDLINENNLTLFLKDLTCNLLFFCCAVSQNPLKNLSYGKLLQFL